MTTTARSENRSSDIVDLEQVLIHFISENFSENDHSASVLVISRVEVMTRRRRMFGKASSSQAPSASQERLFGSSLSVDCQRVFHLLTSFPRDLGNGMSLSQNSMPSTSSFSCSVLFPTIDGTRESRYGGRDDPQEEKESRRGNSYSLLVLIDWTGTYIVTHNIIFGMKKG